MLAGMLLALALAHFQPVTPETTSQVEQVFVHDGSVPAVPEGRPNPHDAGLRPPGGNDPDAATLFTSHNAPLSPSGVTIGQWRGATGTVDVTPTADGGTRLSATFAKLIPNGRYSLFLRQLAGRTGFVFTPIDLTGASNSFFADGDGSGTLTTSAPFLVPTGAQLVLVYHSDKSSHQSSPGEWGANAHAQLITRVP